jgi:hypothetical protein
VAVVIGLVIAFFVLRLIFGGKTPVGQYLALEKSGLRARGLVLACDRTSLGVSANGRRFEKWTMTLDIEVPGREPYVSTGNFLAPRGLVQTAPGSALDLAVHPSKKNLVAVLGPGGFTGPWLSTAPPSRY